MQGYRVPRKGGWDTHGLPVELEVEKELGLKSKPEIEEYGIEEFNAQCRESVFRYVEEWSTLTERIAFWVDIDDAYVTYAQRLHRDRAGGSSSSSGTTACLPGLPLTPHCPRCGTSPLRPRGRAGLPGRHAGPVSVFVKFRLTEESPQRLRAAANSTDDEPIYLVAWTTTPWTLPGNTALAVEARDAVVRHLPPSTTSSLVVAKALGAKSARRDASSQWRWWHAATTSSASATSRSTTRGVGRRRSMRFDAEGRLSPVDEHAEHRGPAPRPRRRLRLAG